MFESAKFVGRRIDGRTLYAAVDVVAILADTKDAAQYWADLKVREPALADMVEQIDFPAAGDRPAESAEAVTMDGRASPRAVDPVGKGRADQTVAGAVGASGSKKLRTPSWRPSARAKLYERKGYRRAGSTSASAASAPATS